MHSLGADRSDRSATPPTALATEQTRNSPPTHLDHVAGLGGLALRLQQRRQLPCQPRALRLHEDLPV